MTEFVVNNWPIRFITTKKMDVGFYGRCFQHATKAIQTRYQLKAVYFEHATRKQILTIVV